jgi:hypothetical protein
VEQGEEEIKESMGSTLSGKEERKGRRSKSA